MSDADQPAGEVLTDGDASRLWQLLKEPQAAVSLAALDRAVERMRAAEGKLRQIAGCAREWKLLVGDDPEALADAILAIISEEEEPGHG